ncbi:MAG: rhodanese-like domain-containing protein [Granulosicoccus sp.]
MTLLPLVVSPTDLVTANNKPVKLLDLRATEAFLDSHLPAAVSADAALLNRSNPPAGGLLPEEQTVNRLLAEAGIHSGDHIVAYDTGAATQAARLIWVLHAFGFTQCSWLNGGFEAWQHAGLATESGSSEPAVGSLRLTRVADNQISVEQLMAELADPALSIVDTRTAAEYAGTDIRSAKGGHVPGAQHFDWNDLFGPDKRLRDDKDLLAEFAAIGVAAGKKTVVYCQTHQRSAVTYVVLKHLGFLHIRALDGAWSNWGNRHDTPKATMDS